MAISDIIQIGDKIDICLVQSKQSMSNSNEQPEIYKSKVLDIKENGNLEISMPTEKGKLILLPLNVRFEFNFYTQSGSVYRSRGQIAERYKKDGFYLLEIELKTPLEKYQRREYYRYRCAMDFTFYQLEEEQKKMNSAEDIYTDVMAGEFEENLCRGVVIDLSGGGMKFRSKYELEAGDKILILLYLKNDKIDRKLHLIGKIISCERCTTSAKAMYECRLNFIIKENRIREEIIRYIFEEDRKIRRKENG